MGAWGPGPFENDAAADFLDEMRPSPSRSVASCLRSIVRTPTGQYIDVDAGGAAWAACELVALAFGFGETAGLVDDVIDLAERLPPKDEQRLLALEALPRIADAENSELAGLWHEGDQGGAFDARIADLRARLESAAEGPRALDKAKAGDIIGFPADADAAEMVIVQVVSAGEVAVFDGVHGPESDFVEAVASVPARRVPAWVNRLHRRGHPLGTAPVRKGLKGRKYYAWEIGAISDYSIATVRGTFKDVSFEEAREFDVDRLHDLDAIRAVALGLQAVVRVRSPDEREADLCARNEEKWAARRKATSPGPFGDTEVVERLVEWIEDYSLENAVARFWDTAAGTIGYGRPNELEERRSYAFAALTAIWRGTWPVEQWPSDLAARLPSPPDERLMGAAEQAARVLVDGLLTRDSELRLIWDQGPDKGAGLRASVASLRQALE